MAKLSKAEIKLHDQACNLLSLRPLTMDEREFILNHWQESANHVNSTAGAFFTPSSLARDLSIYTTGKTIIDLCAGIGSLSFWSWLRAYDRWQYQQSTGNMVCVEINPDYVEIGKLIVPEAIWICGDVFDTEIVRQIEALGPYDCVIGNPPFGRSKNVPLSGITLDLNVVALGARLSRYGVFILSQMSCPFEFSGQRNHTIRHSNNYDKFNRLTGVDLECSSIDCSMSVDEWRGVAPKVEIAIFDLDEQDIRREYNTKDNNVNDIVKSPLPPAPSVSTSHSSSSLPPSLLASIARKNKRSR